MIEEGSIYQLRIIQFGVVLVIVVFKRLHLL